MPPFADMMLPDSLWARGLIALLDLCLALAASVHIVFHKRLPRSALLWLIAVWLAPFFGFLFYWYFGHNRSFKPGPTGRQGWLWRKPSKNPRLRVKGSFRPLDKLVGGLTGEPLRQGNRVKLLKDGAEAYPAMLHAIASARHQIELLTYIFDADSVGNRFLDALALAARRGVRVRVLVDGLGAWVPMNALRRKLKHSGVEMLSFWRTDHLFHQPLVNLRNHKKLVVVDRAVAFTGGLNISERHHKGPLHFRALERLRRRFSKDVERDLHFEVKGPVVASLLDAFESDWAHASKAKVPPPGRAGLRAGNELARVVRSGPDQSLERIYETLLGALRVAEKSVDLCTPYFIPDASLLEMMRSLSLSGLRVRLHLPKNSDHDFMTWASRAYFRQLLECGVEIWQVHGHFIHSKAAVVDDAWCFVGSCNLDPRSFRLNFELNMEVYSKRLAKDLLKVFAEYRSTARKIDLDTLSRQSFFVSLRDHVVKLFSPYL